MAGNPERVTDVEEDASEEENIDIKVEANGDVTSGAGVPSGKSEGNADKDKRQKVGDPIDDLATSMGESAADVPAEEGKRSLVSHEFARAEQAGKSSESDRHKQNENAPTHSKAKRKGLTPHEARMKAIATRAAKKLEATLSGNLLACDMCVFKTCWPGVMARHVKAHAGYVPCACDFCDFKCRGIGLLDKHVIEHHLDEMDTRSKKGGKMKNAKAAVNMKNEAVSSSFEINVKKNLYGPFGNRHRNRKIKNTTEQSSDIPPSPAAEKEPANKEVDSHSSATPDSATKTDSLAKTNLANAQDEANVLAMKLLASLDRRTRTCDLCNFKCRGIIELEEHTKIHSPSLDIPQDDQNVKPMLDYLLMNKRSLQVTPGEDSAVAVTMEKNSARVSKELAGAEQTGLTGESPPQHMEFREVATQSSVTESNRCATSVSNSNQHLPTKKCKVTPTGNGKELKLGDLLRKKISLKLMSAERSTDVTVETGKYSLLNERIADTEQAGTSGESQMKNHTTKQSSDTLTSPAVLKTVTSKLKTFASKPAETHAKKLLRCDGSDDVTTMLSPLNQHMKTHMDVKPYACDFCDFKGRGIKGLKKHMMIHTPSVAFR